MTSSMPTVDVVDGLDMLFLTDRFGDLNSRVDLTSIGMTEAQVAEVSARYASWWREEISFLVYVREPFPDGGHLGLFCEFEIVENYLPELPLSQDDCDLAAWRSTLALFAPAIAHVAQGLRALSEPSGQVGRLVFDLTSGYGGGICVLLPLCDIQVLTSVFDLLYRNNIPFPPSRHARLAGAASVLWRYPQDEIPVAALPGPSCPLPG